MSDGPGIFVSDEDVAYVEISRLGRAASEAGRVRQAAIGDDQKCCGDGAAYGTPPGPTGAAHTAPLLQRHSTHVDYRSAQRSEIPCRPSIVTVIVEIDPRRSGLRALKTRTSIVS